MALSVKAKCVEDAIRIDNRVRDLTCALLRPVVVCI